MTAPYRTVFQSFLMGGFECSTHRRKDRTRLDVIESTRHFACVASDYRALQSAGIGTVRDGLRWHLIEKRPRRYDWSSFLPMFHAARKCGMEVIWDLCHYGWPDDIDVMSPEFLYRFESLVKAFAKLLREEGVSAPFVCPVNEINFLAWVGGDEEYINPWLKGRGDDLKVQLVRASIIGIEAMWSVLPQTRVVHCEPAIYIFPDKPENAQEVGWYLEAQYQALNMIGGYDRPHLEGRPEYLDIIGVNYYAINQWIHKGRSVLPGDPLHRPIRNILAEVFRRYNRPMFIAETGIEGEKRQEWLAHICGEVRAALLDGVPVQGVCWYPILDYPGWDNDRHCCAGALSYPDARGQRKWHEPLWDEFERQRQLFDGIIQPEMAEQTG